MNELYNIFTSDQIVFLIDHLSDSRELKQMSLDDYEQIEENNRTDYDEEMIRIYSEEIENINSILKEINKP
jgi:hypothetical protein